MCRASARAGALLPGLGPPHLCRMRREPVLGSSGPVDGYACTLTSARAGRLRRSRRRRGGLARGPRGAVLLFPDRGFGCLVASFPVLSRDAPSRRGAVRPPRGRARSRRGRGRALMRDGVVPAETRHRRLPGPRRAALVTVVFGLVRVRPRSGHGRSSSGHDRLGLRPSVERLHLRWVRDDARAPAQRTRHLPLGPTGKTRSVTAGTRHALVMLPPEGEGRRMPPL